MDYFLAHKMQLKVGNESHSEMCDIKCCHIDTKSQSSNPDQASGNTDSHDHKHNLQPATCSLVERKDGVEWVPTGNMFPKLPHLIPRRTLNPSNCTVITGFTLAALTPTSPSSKKVQEELGRVVGGRQVQLQDRNNMPYTNAVIHEIQRVANAVPTVLHYTSKDTSSRRQEKRCLWPCCHGNMPDGTFPKSLNWSFL